MQGWSVQSAKPKGLMASASSAGVGGGAGPTSASTSATMKRTPSAEELKLDSNDEEMQRLKAFARRSRAVADLIKEEIDQMNAGHKGA